jgi:DNA gyrase subunit B
MAAPPDDTNYTAASIRVLTAAEAVRRIPGMYIGGDGSDALHRMLLEVIGNAVDEHLNGSATYVRITVDGHRCTVEDDGRGIPPSSIEPVMTQLHAGTAFKRHVHLTADLHGVGVAPVCALSDQLDVEVWRDGRVFEQSFSRGRALGPLRDVAPSTRTGTRISFLPDFSILKRNPWNVDFIVGRCREIAAMNPRLTLIVGLDAFRFVGGLADYLRYINRECSMTAPIHARGHRDGIEVNIALAWTDAAKSIVGFVNGVNADGTHITGFLAGVLRAFRRRSELIGARALQRGMSAVIDVMICDPNWRGPTKEWLLNPEVGAAVASVAGEGIEAAARENPAMIDSLLLRLGAY